MESFSIGILLGTSANPWAEKYTGLLFRLTAMTAPCIFPSSICLLIAVSSSKPIESFNPTVCASVRERFSISNGNDDKLKLQKKSI